MNCLSSFFKTALKPFVYSFDKFVNIFWIFFWFNQITRKRDWIIECWNWTFYRHCLYVILILATAIDPSSFNWTKDGVYIFVISFGKLVILFPFFNCNWCLHSSPRDSFSLVSFWPFSVSCFNFHFLFWQIQNSNSRLLQNENMKIEFKRVTVMKISCNQSHCSKSTCKFVVWMFLFTKKEAKTFFFHITFIFHFFCCLW